ncbi:MAG: hypothetical protein K6G69_03290 [Lachnospiraceae bacterium]|nr:hypothetical protein [Lachnospiraceae bacterium]
MTNRILKNKLNRVLAIALSAILAFNISIPAFATTAVKTSNYVISKLDGARAELEKLAGQRSIGAVIYLKDAYTLKAEADAYSEDVASLATGQSVGIISVDVDDGRNIWYKVTYSYAGGTIEGYAEREFLASNDERFLAWEDRYITTKNREAIRQLGDCSDIEQFPENYRDALYELKKKHPNWIFVRQNVGLNWNTVLSEEGKGERSLISSSADSSYKGAPSANTAGWYNATPGILAYYLDPRNFLSEERIFMFELETFNAGTHTTDSVQKVLNGTFMSGGIPGTGSSYAQAILDIGASLNMSPIALAARLKQEQGVNGTSPLISGTYKGYEGYYNYFNIKANGGTNTLIIENGLKCARDNGWNTRVKSISGGASIIAAYYVGRGQDTLYLQKFDVDASDNKLYTHQYMQNIAAPYNEAYSTYKAYNNAQMLNTAFVFKIPVYDNMPKGRCMKPNATDVLSLNMTEVENLPVDQNAVVTTLINGAAVTDVPMTYTSTNTGIATVDEKGVITGVRPGEAYIKVNRAEDSSQTVQCKVKVIKADIAVSKVDIPELDITYKPDATLADIELPEAFAWADASLVPTVENAGYSVIYSPDNSRYNSLTMTIPVNVAKATYKPEEIKLPTAVTINAGAELGTAVLPEGFVWKDQTLTVRRKTGNVSYDAIYCEDPNCYEPLEVKINVNIVCNEHEYGEWIGEHATCEKDGTLIRTCEICGHTETLKEPATGHDYISEITEEPTEDKTGIRTYTCKNCGDTYTEEIPKLEKAHTHSYTETITKEPTCTETGVKTYTCSCGESYTETIEATGHDYDENNVCKKCGYELPVIPVHIHDYTLSDTTATCTEAGENRFTCSCGDSYTEPAEALGHDFKNGVCTRCKAKEKNEGNLTPKVSITATPKVTPEGSGETEITTPEVTATATPTANATAMAEAEATAAARVTRMAEATSAARATRIAEATAAAQATKAAKATTAATTNAAAQATTAATTNAAVEATKAAKATTAAQASATAGAAAKPSIIPTPTQKPVPTVGNTPAATQKAEGSTPAVTTKAEGSTPAVTTKAEGSTPAVTASTDENKPEATQQTTASTPETTRDNKKNEDITDKKADSKPANNENNTKESGKKEPVKPEIENVDEFTEGERPISIVMMSSTVLDKEKIEEHISANNKKLEVTLANDVVWSLDLSGVSDYSDVNIDLAVDTSDVEVPEETYKAISGDNEVMTIELKHEGSFGFPVTLHIPVDAKYIGKTANMFWYNTDEDKMEYVNECKVGENGMTAFRLSHASKYVIIFADGSLDPSISTATEEKAERSIETGDADKENAVMAASETADNSGNMILIVGAVAIVLILVLGISLAVIVYRKERD